MVKESDIQHTVAKLFHHYGVSRSHVISLCWSCWKVLGSSIPNLCIAYETVCWLPRGYNLVTGIARVPSSERCIPIYSHRCRILSQNYWVTILWKWAHMRTIALYVYLPAFGSFSCGPSHCGQRLPQIQTCLFVLLGPKLHLIPHVGCHRYEGLIFLRMQHLSRRELVLSLPICLLSQSFRNHKTATKLVIIPVNLQ